MASARFASSRSGPRAARAGARRPPGASAGFSIVEVVVAMFILTAVSLGVAQLFAIGTQANWRAKAQTSSTVLAVQKMEQLRGLTWGFDGDGFPVSDLTSRLDTAVQAGGGTGLTPSPADSLFADRNGFVDYLDVHGGYLGTNAENGAAFCRRWSIQPLPTNPNNTLIFQVRVIPMTQLETADRTGRRAPDETRLFTMKTRKAP